MAVFHPALRGRQSGFVSQVTLTSGLRLGVRSSCADSEPIKGTFEMKSKRILFVGGKPSRS